VKVTLFQWFLWATGLALQFLVLSALGRGAWRRYPFLLLFTSVLSATTISDIYMYLTVRDRDLWLTYYWSAEVMRQTAVFLLVAGFAVSATPPSARGAGLALRVAVLTGALYWAGCLALTHDPDRSQWMTRFVRNLSFGSAVVNLGVWFYLISTGQRRVITLLLAGGLGIQMTGEAIGQSLRQMFPHNYEIGNVVGVVAHFACLLIWWRALSSEKQPTRAAGTRTAGH
jgi:hypothetical protein